MRNVSKTFGTVKALTGVHLEVAAGEIHALMGENGAGKSTLMKILSGAYVPDAGSEILIEGSPVTISGPQDGRAAGIAVIYQELALSPNLSVAENMYLGRENARWGLTLRSQMNAAVKPLLKRLGADFQAETKVETLSIAQRQVVEIARALHSNSRILVMDEPTTALSSNETDRLFALVRQLRNDGLAIIYISHRMEEIDALADRVTVLRDGGYVGTLDRADVSTDKIVRLMVGRDASSFYKKNHRADALGSEPVLSVSNLSDGARVLDASFELRAGEVVGLSGLVGAGRTELAELIYGARRRVAGDVVLCGSAYSAPSAQTSLARGLAYLTEDRKHLGLFLDMTCLENINLGVIGRDSYPGGFLNRGRGRQRANVAFNTLRVRAPNPQTTVGSLSGGNQQKVLLARLLETQPKVLILDEPTRGVDVGSKSEIYQIIDNLAQSGVGILVISSDLPEIIGICDRVLVMREGQVVGEVKADASGDITEERIMTLATGASRQAA